jgi:ankyrin repeat protein
LIYLVNANVHTLNVKKAMLYLCERNNIELVKFLVNMGFDLNNILIQKKSPLFVACEYNYIELATYLIQRFETDPNIQSEDSKKTALYICSEKGYS